MCIVDVKREKNKKKRKIKKKEKEKRKQKKKKNIIKKCVFVLVFLLCYKK